MPAPAAPDRLATGHLPAAAEPLQPRPVIELPARAEPRSPGADDPALPENVVVLHAPEAEVAQ